MCVRICGYTRDQLTFTKVKCVKIYRYIRDQLTFTKVKYVLEFVVTSMIS
jgi:hypothetical protein